MTPFYFIISVTVPIKRKLIKAFTISPENYGSEIFYCAYPLLIILIYIENAANPKCVLITPLHVPNYTFIYVCEFSCKSNTLYCMQKLICTFDRVVIHVLPCVIFKCALLNVYFSNAYLKIVQMCKKYTPKVSLHMCFACI